jgi:hypothetical protein
MQRSARLASLSSEGTATAFDIIARSGLLSVTESVCAPASTKKGGHMPDTPSFSFREWLVPPILVPLFLGLLIAASVVFR